MVKLTEICAAIQQITISEVSTLDSVNTSEVVLYGIPWCVEVFKKESSLRVRLLCKCKDDSSDWSIPAGVSCKLLPLSDDVDAIKGCASNVFGRKLLESNEFVLIKWNDLLNGNNEYVKDDTVKLELKIEAKDPNDPNKSVAKLWRDCDNDTKFQLNVKNVSNLLAAQANPFKLNELSWYITVGKDSSSDGLAAYLDFEEPTNKKLCNVAWSLKLMSLKGDVNPNEQTEAGVLSCTDYSLINNIVSWDDLFKPENGFVNNDTITMELEMKSIKPCRGGASGTPTAKRVKQEPMSSSS